MAKGFAKDPDNDGRKRRKKAPRPPVHPVHSAASKLRWADPIIRERNLAGLRAYYERRRNDPHKLWSRRGTFDGLTREQSQAAWAEARASAKKTVAELIEKDLVDLPENDEDRARFEEAMEATLTVMRTPANNDTKLKAARQVMEWTKAKPESKKKVTVESAEDFLAAALASEA